jgi:predicted O-methyltransferase YrrM
MMNQLQKILQERPTFHQSETEILRQFSPEESLLPPEVVKTLASRSLTCHGIEPAVLSFIADSVNDQSRTLETGSGCSTLVFGLRRTLHTAVTPSSSEPQLIRKYAAENGINMDRVTFVQETSENYLPYCKESGFDLILLDGKHAFPWPVVDWFFTADKLKKGGIMILDDSHMRAVRVLAEFMVVDPGWKLVQDFSGKTIAFQKVREFIHDVAWHMQPWMLQPGEAIESGGLMAGFTKTFHRALGKK